MSDVEFFSDDEIPKAKSSNVVEEEFDLSVSEDDNSSPGVFSWVFNSYFVVAVGSSSNNS